MLCLLSFFFFKQKTAYEMRISDWSSDVCSSDLDLCLSVRLSFAVQPAAVPTGLVSQSRSADTDPRRRRSVTPTPRWARAPRGGVRRSEERRVGKECVSTYRSRG